MQEKPSDLGHIEADEAIARLERRFRAIYGQANREVQEQMNEYLKRFAKQDEQKLKQLHEGKITQEEYKQWYQNRVLAGKRWQERLNTMANHYVNANVEATAAINHELPRVYADNFNYSAFLTEQQVQADLSYQLVDQWTVEKLARDHPELLPQPSVDIPKDQRWNKQKIMSAITQGIVQGDSIDKIARRLRKVTDMNSASAVRNARTAVTGAECAGRVNSYQEATRRGVQMVQEWMATLDGRTRHSHAVLDGESIEVGGTFSNGCKYPGDPSGAPSEVYNCRCTIIGRVKGYEKYHQTRWIADGKEQQGAGSKYGTGKLNGESYSEWKERHRAAMAKKKR